MKRIAIFSDSHDHLPNLLKAVQLAKEEKAEMIIHLGDYVAPFTLPILEKSGLPLIGVFGNNDGEKEGLSMKVQSFGEIHPPPLQIEIEGIKVLLSHAPMSIEAVKSKYPDTKLFLHGHTHILRDQQVDGVRIINPGEICGYLSEKTTFGILDFPELVYKIIEIK